MELPLVLSYIVIIFSTILLCYALYLTRENHRSQREESQLQEIVLVTTAEAEGKLSPHLKPQVLEYTDGAFQLRLEPVAGDFTVYTKISVLGAVTGNITVHSDGMMKLYGICAGNLIVNSRGSAVVYGTVVGSVTNNGGELHIFGKIIGPLNQNRGETIIHPVAQLNTMPSLAASTQK